MALTQEEIKIRLGFDGKELDAGTKKAMAELAQLDGRVKEHAVWWRHVGSEAKAYHKILEKLSEASPALGAGLKLFLDPWIGSLLLIGTLIPLIIEKFKAMQEVAKEAAASASEAFTKSIEAFGTRGEVGRKVAEKSGEASRNTGGLSGEALERVRTIANLEKEIEFDSKRLTENLEKEKKTRLDAEHAARNLKDTEGDILATHRSEWRMELDQYEALKRRIDLESEHLENKKNKLLELHETEKDEEDTNKKVVEWMDDQFETAKALNEEEEKLNKLDLERKRNLQELVNKNRDYELSFNRMQRALDKEKTSGYIPSLGDLAKQNSPYGYLARQVLLAQEGSKQALGQTGPGGLSALQSRLNEIYGEGRAEYAAAAGDPIAQAKAYQKYGQRISALIGGRSTAEDALIETAEQMRALNDKAEREGIKVIPIGVD